MFSQIPGPYSFNEILEGVGDIYQEEEISVPNQATAGGETEVLREFPAATTQNRPAPAISPVVDLRYDQCAMRPGIGAGTSDRK